MGKCTRSIYSYLLGGSDSPISVEVSIHEIAVTWRNLDFPVTILTGVGILYEVAATKD